MRIIFTLQSSRCQIAEDGDVRGWQLCTWSSCIPRYLEPHNTVCTMRHVWS